MSAALTELATLDVTAMEREFFESDAATAMSCRASFQEDEEYEQLRRPNPGPGAVIPIVPQLAPTLPLEQHLFNEFAPVGYAPAAFTPGPPVIYAAPSQPPIMADLASGFGHSKLSASAAEYIPNQSNNTNMGKRGPPPHQQPYQHHSSGPTPYAVQHQQRYLNGHKQQQQHQHQQHKNYNHHPQNQQYNNDMQKLSNSVQARLHIGHPPHNGAMSNYYQQQQPPQQQQYFHQQPQPSTSSAAVSTSSASSHPDMETIALEYLDTVIHCLNQNPGQFDTIASRFLTIFDGMESNNYVLSIAMEDIFEKSIEQPNFRYMGAKLYNLLHMLNLKPDSLFHTLLKCKLDYHRAEVDKYMQSIEQQQKVRETALFLAELYMQLRGDDDARIQLIAVNIVYSLKKLLAYESSENVRCICQTLKLAGYDLSADCKEDMQFIIASLQAFEYKSPGKYAMVANVIALQQNNWGRKVSNALGGDDDSVAKPPEPPRLSDEPVFYGPDGRELTAEETDFLAAEDDDATGSDGDEFDVRDTDLDLDPEMDEETERAYKDFCKQGKQLQANKKS
ncbi:polyadenylate-binding protein-interacting protein 1 isoform X4 [Drosophila hydei]|uniref:Polyadenylate-binding protein-interacting protein 1 isoform X4 n=1 Tax=Drosophila hydei TaxID=7224 RepID=A0A6J1LVE7_DROHY|nr:polyadenylate-binding protein-interacting protein 1 isoform X4 [Drosophila hydei]